MRFERAVCRWEGPPEAVEEVLAVLERVGLATVSREGPPPFEVECLERRSYTGEDVYSYQREGVEDILQGLKVRGAHLLADPMGLGKSAQVLRALDALERPPLRILIVCPAVVIHHWQEEIKKWLSLPSELVGRARSKKEGSGRLLDWTGYGIVSYDTLRGLWKKLPHVDALVLDELHYLASAKSLRSKAVRGFLEDHPKRPLIVGLTGTPMTARPRDLWNPLDILFPGRFGNAWAFQKRYCDGRFVDIQGLEKPVWDCSGRSNLEELGRRLRSGLMTRRDPAEVLDLPPRRRIMMPVELPPKARKGLARATSILAGSDVGRLLSEIEEHKIKAAIELAEDCKANGKRPLLFTLRRETARQLGEALSAPYVTGEDEASSRRDKLLSGDIGVATVYSVTTGINLTQFDTAIFVGLDWVPSTLLQAEARLHRIGQEANVTIYYLIGLGTLDETVRSVVLERLETFGTVVGDASSEAELATTLKGGKSEEDVMSEILANIMKGVL